MARKNEVKARLMRMVLDRVGAHPPVSGPSVTVGDECRATGSEHK